MSRKKFSPCPGGRGIPVASLPRYIDSTHCIIISCSLPIVHSVNISKEYHALLSGGFCTIGVFPAPRLAYIHSCSCTGDQFQQQ